MRGYALAAVAALFMFSVSVASAAPKTIDCDDRGCREVVQSLHGRERGGNVGTTSLQRRLDGRPADCTQRGRWIPWCGCWMAKHLGLPRNYNGLNLDAAREYARLGSPAPHGAVGALAVWRHHVALITGDGSAPNSRVMISGNDGGAVRERERSLRGVIAFRFPPGRYASAN